MSYELAVMLKGGWIEIEAESPAALEKRIASLDLRRIEAAIRKARSGGTRRGTTPASKRRKPRRA